MIFVTVGTQLGFDRLVQAVDGWAGAHPDAEVFVQMGKGQYRPRHCDYEAFTGPERWEALFRSAERVVSHAGMGTILKGLEHAKPLVVMPRLAELGEHRNDHQCDTVRRLGDARSIQVVHNPRELMDALECPPPSAGQGPGSNGNLDTLLETLRRFVGEAS